MFIYDAAMKYMAEGTPTVIFLQVGMQPARRATGPPKACNSLGIKTGGARTTYSS
jgi:hypothetical protein